MTPEQAHEIRQLGEMAHAALLSGLRQLALSSNGYFQVWPTGRVSCEFEDIDLTDLLAQIIERVQTAMSDRSAIAIIDARPILRLNPSRNEGPSMSNAIEDLPTEAEREAARKIVAVMEPLSVADRHKVLRELAKHFPDLRFGYATKPSK